MGWGGRASGGLLRKTREKGKKEISAKVFFFSGGGEKNRGIERKRSDRGEAFGWSFLEKGARWSPKQDRYFFSVSSFIAFFFVGSLRFQFLLVLFFVSSTLLVELLCFL